MEENKDLVNENNINEEDHLKKASITDNTEKNIAELNNNNSTENNLDPSKPDKNNEFINKINKEKSETNRSGDIKIKPKKEIPIEKKPFNEFVNDHLLPALISAFKDRGLEVKDINLKNTYRPIAGDECWVIYCEVKDACNFWLSFEKDDISSLKSFSLCGSNQEPSVIESFLIDEKRITLKLIISRILQRLNGQKLIGVN